MICRATIMETDDLSARISAATQAAPACSLLLLASFIPQCGESSRSAGTSSRSTTQLRYGGTMFAFRSIFSQK